MTLFGFQYFLLIRGMPDNPIPPPTPPLEPTRPTINLVNSPHVNFYT